MGGLPVVGVVGAGAMGAGIAQVAAAAGHSVLLLDSVVGVAAEAKAKVGASLAKVVEKGRMTSEEREALLGRITPCDDLGAFSIVGLVIEAVVEDGEVKKALFRELEGVVSGEALLASNTSSLSITELGGCLKDPSRFAGMHFFNPAPLMPLVEVVRGLVTSSSTVSTLVETAKAWGKTAVVAKNAPGFIVNKGARPFYGEALKFVEEGGTDVATYDALMRAAGFKMGPFELIDLIGLDINLAVSKRMWEAYYGEPRYQPSMMVEEMVAAGFLGRKSGKGFYDYGGEAKAEPEVLPQCKPPARISVTGELGLAEVLVELWQQAGIEVERLPWSERTLKEPFQDWGCIRAEGLYLLPAAPAIHGGTVVSYDFAFDYAACEHLAIAGMSDHSIELAAGLFQAVGKRVSLVKIGLPVTRTVSMLVNEAADTVSRSIASADDIDEAMQKGLGYPFAPLELCDRLGAHFFLSRLDRLEGWSREPRYRASLRLREALNPEAKFHA